MLGFLLPLLAPSEVEPLKDRVAQTERDLQAARRQIALRPVPTPTPVYEANAPVPITPSGYPLERSPDCKWAGPASGFQQAGGRLCVYKTKGQKFFHLTMRIGDDCTGRGIPTAEVVLKFRRWMLRATSERGASVAFMNLPMPTKNGRPHMKVSAVTITSAPGYRTRIERQSYSGGGMWVGSTNLIPLKGVDLPDECSGTIFRPKYLRRG